jgi:flagellar protein FliO/FliZ
MQIKATAAWRGLAVFAAIRPARALAADPAPTELEPPSQWEMLGNLLYVIFILGVIVALIVLLIKFLSKSSRQFFSAKGIQLLAGIQLGQNKSLQIVEIGNRIYVLGVGDTVHLIDKIDDEAEAERIRRMIWDADASGSAGWQRIWARLTGRRRPERPDRSAGSASFQEIFYEKLNKVGESRKQQLEEWMRQADETEDRR